MAKKEQTKTYRKYEVLKSQDLNSSFGDVGSIEGLLPYGADRKVDKGMRYDIGRKDAPFGNLYAKGLNIFTTAEVLAFAAEGILTAEDRMPFVNTADGQWYLWNGSQIVPMGGSGGTGMDYLYGDGSDGDITAVANSNFTKAYYQFNNFTLNPEVTWGSTLQEPIVLSVKGQCRLSGSINLNAKGLLGGIFGASGQDGNSISSNIAGMALGGYYGNGLHYQPNALAVLASKKAPIAANKELLILAIKSGLLFINPICGGGGGGGANGALASGNGGNGGGGLIIYANELIIDTTFSFTANASNGGTSAGGGGGGCLLAGYKSGTINPHNFSANAGQAGTTNTSSANNNVGGNGGNGSGAGGYGGGTSVGGAIAGTAGLELFVQMQ
ncbi:hypothetical protein Emin_0940 [Elusimicrobium minutum Pei191]|uniref:Uncharacterized protein n=1 Tax=Elusimicrobium minutum (strain Pei191) TaxID=445932 RepID=B2KD97_ELUMP|nr:hypothetical protein [Elusimicrobium minutum]ACC98493.1 hypothetical protein Emin_0940 [Elusimicrobium minutum Pei191]